MARSLEQPAIQTWPHRQRMKTMRMDKAMQWGVLLALCCAPAMAADPLFDRPLREKHVPLPSDPLNPQLKARLSCFYYPHLMVKQVDLGEKGADQLSMTYVGKGQAEPACRRARGKDEKIVSGWGGYFRGVRGSYVFFDADDGSGGGLGFAVFNAGDEQKLFTDIAAELHAVALSGPVQDPDARPWYENPLVLRYRRVYQAPCSLRADAQGCWATIKSATGLAQAAPPDCAAAYAASESSTDKEQLAMMRADPSMIEYEVEAVLDGHGVIRLSPAGAAMACYPAP
jgi:hypothetical protein